jgi:transposase-like protein
MKNNEKDMYLKVEAWKQSGMNMTEYAKSIGMLKAAFEYWVRKFRNAQKKEDAGFVEILPTLSKEKEQKPSGQMPMQQHQGEIVFSFANGMSIKVSF